MVSLEYLPYYWKPFSHILQLYTLGVGKYFHMLKFDLYQGHMISTPARHRRSAKSADHRGFLFYTYVHAIKNAS